MSSKTAEPYRIRKPNRRRTGVRACNGSCRDPQNRSRKVCACGNHSARAHKPRRAFRMRRTIRGVSDE